MLCREREPECLYDVPVSDRWNMHFVMLLCLLRLSTLSSLDVLKSVMGDIKRVTREVAIQIPTDQSWLEKTLYRLIVDVPAEHLNLFKTNPSLDLNSLSLVVKGTFVV